jgi:hypothetical protein
MLIVSGYDDVAFRSRAVSLTDSYGFTLAIGFAESNITDEPTISIETRAPIPNNVCLLWKDLIARLRRDPDSGFTITNFVARIYAQLTSG